MQTKTESLHISVTSTAQANVSKLVNSGSFIIQSPVINNKNVIVTVAKSSAHVSIPEISFPGK